ncbi:MAG: hypothetical protein ACLPLP_03000 [Mycobacterium sp.]
MPPPAGGGGVLVGERGIQEGLAEIRDPEQLVGAGVAILTDAVEQRADRELIYVPDRRARPARTPPELLVGGQEVDRLAADPNRTNAHYT